MTAMLPVHLTESVNNLSDAARTMTEEIRLDREQRAAENRRMVALLVVVMVLVAGLVLLSVSNRRLGSANAAANRQNAALNKQNARIVERIESCTTTGGECYEQGAERTNEAITQLTTRLLRGDIAVAQCAKSTDTDRELEACVSRYVAGLTTRPATPGPSAKTP